jgi:hypothetical protein
VPPTARCGGFSVLRVGKAGERPADGDACGIEASRCMNGLDMGVVTEGPLGRGTLPSLVVADDAMEESGAAASDRGAEPGQVAKETSAERFERRVRETPPGRNTPS